MIKKGNTIGFIFVLSKLLLYYIHCLGINSAWEQLVKDIKIGLINSGDFNRVIKTAEQRTTEASFSISLSLSLSLSR